MVQPLAGCSLYRMLLWTGMAGKTALMFATLTTVVLAGCTSEPSTGDTVLDQLAATYVDQPFKGGQDTPEHSWLLPTSDTMLFLHWDHVEPREASSLLFVGDGFRAKGCIGAGGVSQAQINDGFVHFHKETSSNWDQGHHTSANPNTMGWWLRHVGATDGPGPMPGMPAISEGEIYPLMPSNENAPACG